MSGQGSNRRLGEQHEGPASKRSLRSSDTASGKKAKTFEPLNPYEIPEPVDAIEPSELLSLPGFSKEVYAQDMFLIFSASTQSNPELAEMHEAWFDSRKPSLEELWQSRHPAHGLYAEKPASNCHRKSPASQIADAPDGSFDANVRLLYVVGTAIAPLSGLQPAVSKLDRCCSALKFLAGKVITPETLIAPETRAKMESFIVDPLTVVPLDSISGNEQGKKMIKQAIFIPTRLPHLAAEGLGSQGILLHGPPGTGKTLLAQSRNNGTTTPPKSNIAR
ncbi:MAG: hypothetical protein Q9191_003455 [Dirinaria sp. TL-2023a]